MTLDLVKVSSWQISEDKLLSMVQAKAELNYDQLMRELEWMKNRLKHILILILSKTRCQRSGRKKMEYYQANSLKSSQRSLLLQLRLKDMIRRESAWHSHPENFPVKKRH